MLAEKFFLVLETVISHTYRDGSPRVVSTSRSDQTAEREREVGSARSTTLRRRLVCAGHAEVQRDASIPWLDGPQLLRTGRVYSPFAKRVLASRDEDLRPGAMSAAGD